jgi:hypothetical protein
LILIQNKGNILGAGSQVQKEEEEKEKTLEKTQKTRKANWREGGRAKGGEEGRPLQRHPEQAGDSWRPV